MKIAVAKEIDPSEPRVAVSPDTVKKFRALGAEIAVEPGAGIKSGLPDSEFTADNRPSPKHEAAKEGRWGWRPQSQ
jgi:NAD/NADP transhydrogenase alpha subunit